MNTQLLALKRMQTIANELPALIVRAEAGEDVGDDVERNAADYLSAKHKTISGVWLEGEDEPTSYCASKVVERLIF